MSIYLDQQEKIIIRCETVSEHEVEYTGCRLVVSISDTRYCICNITDNGSLSLGRLDVR